jgi:hypothetical protein
MIEFYEVFFFPINSLRAHIFILRLLMFMEDYYKFFYSHNPHMLNLDILSIF